MNHQTKTSKVAKKWDIEGNHTKIVQSFRILYIFLTILDIKMIKRLIKALENRRAAKNRQRTGEIGSSATSKHSIGNECWKQLNSFHSHCFGQTRQVGFCSFLVMLVLIWYGFWLLLLMVFFCWLFFVFVCVCLN